MKSRLFSLIAGLAVTSQAFCGLLPEVDAVQWGGQFAGSTVLDPTTGSLSAVVTIQNQIDNFGKEPIPVPYENGSAPNGTGHFVPVFDDVGVEAELLATIRDLSLFAAFDRSANTWLTGAGLIGYVATNGDTLLFGDPADLLAGNAGLDGGQFDVLYNTSNEFENTTLAAGQLASGGSSEFNGVGGVNAGGADPNVDSLWTGVFQNLFADSNGTFQTSNMNLFGALLTDAALGGLGQFALLAIDVTAPANPGGATTGTKISNWYAHVDITGGSEFSAINNDAVAILDIDGSTYSPVSGRTTTDLKFEATFSGPSSGSLLTSTSGSFTFVSQPEPASIALWAGMFGALAVAGYRRRKAAN